MHNPPESPTLKKLLDHGAFAPHPVGHFDELEHRYLVGPHDNHVDALHGLAAEILGSSRVLIAHDGATGPGEPDADGESMITPTAGDAP